VVEEDDVRGDRSYERANEHARLAHEAVRRLRRLHTFATPKESTRHVNKLANQGLADRKVSTSTRMLV
jgi:hypothetical protein